MKDSNPQSIHAMSGGTAGSGLHGSLTLGHQSSSGGQPNSLSQGNFPGHQYQVGMPFMQYSPYQMYGMGNFFPYTPGLHPQMSSGSQNMMYHNANGVGFPVPTPKEAKSKHPISLEKENSRLQKGSSGVLLGLQNIGKYKLNKNSNPAKAKDATNNDEDEQDDNNGEPDRGQAIEPAQGDDKKGAADTGVSTSKGKV